MKMSTHHAGNSITVNALLGTASILLALVGIEGYLALEDQPHDAKKRMFEVPGHFGHCYSSDPTNYWPISLRERPADRALLGDILPALVVDQLVAETPYCILYDVNNRREGLSPGQATQIALVGDSFCFGEGLREKDTLGYLLGSRYGDCNFRNLGWPGTDIEQVSTMVERALRELPDLRSIVYIFNLNDIPDAYNQMAQKKRIHDLENIRWDSPAAPGKGLSSILEKTRISRLVRKSWILRRESAATIREYLAMYLDPARNEGFLALRRRLQAMRDEVRSAGIEPVVVIYPLLYKDRIGRYPFKNFHN